MATMLDCKSIQNDLSGYVDGTLDGDRSWAIKMHVTSCAVCDQIVRDFGATARLVGSLPRLEPSEGFEAALARRLADQALTPQKSLPLWGRMGEVAASVWDKTPRLRPVFLAPSLALAALIPVAFFVAAQQKPMSNPGAATTPPALAQQVRPTLTDDASKDAKDGTLDELINDHVAYAASEPLGDPAGMLSARSTNAAVTGDRSL